jgi:hypothetical protein
MPIQYNTIYGHKDDPGSSSLCFYIIIQVFATTPLSICPIINIMQSEAQTKFLESVRSEWEAAQTSEDATKVFSKLMDAEAVDE